MKKKNYIIILIILLLIPTFSNPINTEQTKSKYCDLEVIPSAEPPPIPFIFGSRDELYQIDPIDIDYLYENILINQVTETLMSYDYTSPDLTLKYSLATFYQPSLDLLNYTIILRENVLFHDGTQFNSSAVQWNFDRLAYWFNFTGTLPSSLALGESILEFHFEDGLTPIWNHTEIINTYTIKIVLNAPFSAFPRLLTHSAMSMLSPTSTPFYDRLNRSTDKIVGTGPFIYDEYTFPYNITLHANENYWAGKAHIDEMIISYYSDPILLSNALLTGDIHFTDYILPTMLDTLKAADNLTVLDEGITVPGGLELIFNNHLLNKSMRQAMSYAINYSYIIEDLMANTTVRIKSPILEGFLYSNYSFDYPVFNITKARMIMQSMGFGVGYNATYPGTDDALWQSETFATYSFWVYAPSAFMNNLFALCENTFDLIGITLVPELTDWETFINSFITDPDWIDIFYYGIHSSYNDPSFIVSRLFSNSSIINYGQVNDPYLQNLIDQGITETNPVLRETIYDEIQRYCVEDLMPAAWLFSQKIRYAHNVNLTGFTQNVLNRIYFYDCEWRPYTYDINIISSGDTSFVEGSTGNTISWTITTDYVENPSYNIYLDDELNSTGIWEYDEPIVIDVDNLIVGTYEYRIEVNNSDNTAYDTISVNVNPLTLDISHPADISFTKGSTGNTISWYITTNLELNPTYIIYENDSQVDTNSWQSLEPVIYNLDHLSVGSYEYKIEASTGDEFIEDIVIVTVLKSKKEPIIPGFSPLIVIGIIVFIIFYIHRKIRRKLL